MEVETIIEEAEPDVSSQLHNTSPPTTDVPIRDRGLGEVKETGPPISSSLGAMRALIGKLDMLLDPLSPQGCSSKMVKDGMRLLKDDVEKMSSYLDDLSEVEDPPPTAKCWMNEARDLSYNMEDYLDNLLFVPPEDPSLVTSNIKTTISLHKWFSCVKTHKTNKTQDNSAETLSKFRIYVQEAIERHQRYNLHSCNTIRRRFVSLGPMLPPGPYEETPNIVIDSQMDKFINSLANDEDQQLKVLAVLGSACLGKTTLARALYNRFGKQYSCRAFIRVSKKPDMKIIFHEMLSQLQRQQPPQHYMEIDLIHNIKQYLQDRRYLIIIDDVWAASVWDILNHVFPKGNHGSRIITTTQIEDVALTCCSDQSEYVFEMKHLDDDHSRKLFFNRLYGSESDCPEQFREDLDEIVELCGGLPLATISIASLLASQPAMTIDLLMYIRRSLSSLFSVNPTSEITRHALSLNFNNLPHYLKTCLIYLSMYQEGYTFRKDDLVNQWIAEGFIDTIEGQDMDKVAESYLHQLMGRGFIQPIRINYNNEVLSYTVHDVVHDLITLKSAEENFAVAIDYSQKNVALSHKARRLSLLFGDARHAKTPANIIKSQVRSLTYFGFFQCMPRITEFKLLCILNLQLSGHHGDDDSVDLTGISELFQLRYLKIASNACIKLPNHGLQCLETLDMNATIVFDPRDIHLPNLLHLRIPIDINLSTWSLNMNSFGYLQDLHLTTSSASPSFRGRGIEDLSSLIRGHVNLKTVVVAHGSSVQNIVDRGSSKETIYWNHMESPPFLQSFEFSRHSGCIFSRIPPWVEKHDNLSILKIAVKELHMICVSILRGLPALTALSLHVEMMPVDKIIFDKPGFSVLKYMKLRFTSVVLLKFEADAMPNLLKLKLVVNDIPRMDQHQHATAGIILDHMAGLEEVSVKFGGAAADVEYALRTFVSNHPSNPTISMQPVNYSSCDEENTKRKHRQGEIVEDEPVEYYEQQQDEIVDDESIEYYKQQQDEIVEDEPVEYYKQQPDEIVEEERVEYYKQQPDKIVGGKPVEYYKQQPYKIAEEEPVEYDKTLEIPAVKRIPRSPEPSLHVHVPEKETLWGSGEKSQSIQVDVNKVGLHEFTLDKLMSATSNFSEKNLLGEGTFGTTYKGTLDAKRMVAITKLPFGSWLPELEYLGTMRYPHVVSLLGYCHQDTHNIYVYEYMPRGSLKHHLFETNLAPLPWLTRLKIAVGAAKGLFFLHESANRRLCGGFGASSILLASDYTAKLWGFVLEMHDDLMKKINVFDFGVVLLELLAGRPAVDEEKHGPERNLVDMLTPYMCHKDKLHHIMDPRLEGQYSLSAASITAKIARRCVQSKPEKRPSMLNVVEALEPLLSDDRNDGQLMASGKPDSKTKLPQYFTRKSKAKSQSERKS